MKDERLLKEYYEILQLVNKFDERLLTVKGWGVTLALAALAWGFQYGHYGLFLVGALGGLGFWVIEGLMKRHQMRYYLRMREIEVLQYESAQEDIGKAYSSPRIDSSWTYADNLYTNTGRREYVPTQIDGPKLSYRLSWFFPHVFLPHAISFFAGITLLFLGIYGFLGDMNW